MGARCFLRGVNHSYIDFSPLAEQHGAEDQFFAVDSIIGDTWASRVDININNVQTTVGPTTLTAGFRKDPSSDRASMDISLDLSSNAPTIICEHFIDCPDVELTNMRVEAQLTGIAPTADRSQLGFDAPLVTFTFDKDINNTPDWFVELFTDIDKIIRSKVESTLEAALGKDKTRTALNQALTGLAEHFANQAITTYYGAWYDGGDLVVDYKPNTGVPADVALNACTAVISTGP